MKQIVGVMGPGEQATPQDCQLAYELGGLIAEQGWVLLTGGRATGVMEAASQGAKQRNGTTMGVLPTADQAAASAALDIVVLTGMGNARNVINVLTSHVIIACGMGKGTASEVAFALKADKPVILLNVSACCSAFFQELAADQVQIAQNAAMAIAQAKLYLAEPAP